MKTFKPLIFAAGLLLSACLVRVPGPPGVVFAPGPPPAPRTEVVGVAPGPEFFWIAGHYYWSGGAYLWYPGRWEHRRPGHMWIGGHWVHHPRGHYWQPGHWR